MARSIGARVFPALVLGAVFGAVVALVTAETVDPLNDGSQFAYGENVGWINAEPLGDGAAGVTVSPTKLTGYMYGENIGWISMSCDNNNTCGSVSYGVTNNGAGVLGGYAWGENVGWISFSCANTGSCGTSNYGVTIDPVTGVFSGYAWGENIGWVSFSDDSPVAYRVQTDPGDTDGDGCPNLKELAGDHVFGGQRDALSPWDFFDVPVPYSPTHTTSGLNKAINGADVLAVRDATGTLQGLPGYNNQYDRTPNLDVTKPWRAGPPDGAVSGKDVLVARDSTGDSCL